MKRNLAVVLHSFAPVFVGGLVYIIWRPLSLIMFKWFDYLYLAPVINLLRGMQIAAPEWLIYSLPSGLWIYSFSFSLIFLWLTSQSRQKYFWMALAPAVAVGSELGQLAGVLPGRFDFLDLSLYLGFIWLSFASAKKIREKYWEVCK